MIKIATIEDLDALAEMSKQFGSEANMPYVLEDIMKSMVKWIEDDDSVILLSDQGMACLSLGPLFFNHKILVAQEHFWFIKKEHRRSGVGSEFLKALEKWTVDNDGTALLMIALMSSSPEKAEAMYFNQGYVPFERSYIKYL